MKPTTRLRQLLKEPGIIVAPSCWDALTAKLIEEAGFQCAYIGAASVTFAHLGMPDVGLITMTELATVARNVVGAVNIPTFCDIDTGFGGPINVRRSIREFEASGLAGVHIEDQTATKHCGHMAGKEVISTEAMVQKIQVAVESRQDPDFVVMARTDAVLAEGFNAALERAQHYAAAGADVIYFESPRSVEELQTIASAIPVPVLVGLPEYGITPLLTTKQLEAIGIKIVTFPRSVRLALVRAALDVLREIRENGATEGIMDRMADDEDVQRLIGTHEAAEFLARFA